VGLKHQVSLESVPEVKEFLKKIAAEINNGGQTGKRAD